MLCSALYHLMYCQSEHDYRKWLKWDVFGIVVGIMGCYIPGVYYAFYCNTVWLQTR
jgi:predicted membrane channel-forming protein YqfA (hemolysin III family)